MMVEFMQKKYSLDELVSHYLESIKALRPLIKDPNDERKLQEYYQAASVFRGVSTKEMAQFALSFGRNYGGKAEQMRNAFPTLLANRVMKASKIDAEYAKILLAYSAAFREYRGNLKEWLLRMVICSRFSPLSSMVEREIDIVIEETKSKINLFSRAS